MAGRQLLSQEGGMVQYYVPSVSQKNKKKKIIVPLNPILTGLPKVRSKQGARSQKVSACRSHPLPAAAPSRTVERRETLPGFDTLPSDNRSG